MFSSNSLVGSGNYLQINKNKNYSTCDNEISKFQTNFLVPSWSFDSLSHLLTPFLSL